MRIRRLAILCLATSIVAALGCSKAKEEESFFDSDKPVDMTSILQAYQWYEQQTEVDYQEFYTKLLPDLPEEDFYLFGDTSFVIRLPQYAQAEQPFLAQAEYFYNGCAFSWNIYSNYEVYYRGMTSHSISGTEEARPYTEAISADIINNDELHRAAKAYKNAMLAAMALTEEELQDDDAPNIGGYMSDFNAVIERTAYRFYDDEDEFVAFLDSVSSMATSLASDRFERYSAANEKEQLSVILHEMADCQSFDEQCSLWLSWADCNKSGGEDEWLVATAIQLMKSGRYFPFLNKIWISWRALCQGSLLGNSRDSFIPNNYYNDYRQLCYKTCLHRIDRHPDDAVAMNCAASIAGRTNMNRFGQYAFGNEAVMELYSMLPNRFNDSEEESEEEN